MNSENKNDQKHQEKMAKQKAKVDAAIARADKEQGVVIVLTGTGKGKSSSGFGTLLRSMGHGNKVGLVQFIKGNWGDGAVVGERAMFQEMPLMTHKMMGSGFTWETQDKSKDQEAFDHIWPQAKAMLQDESIHTVMFDELTYMLAYKLLAWEDLKEALESRPKMQNVIITGRGAPSALRDFADTVTDMKSEKHAFQAGIKAQAGIEW